MFPTSQSPHPCLHVLSFDADPLLTTISRSGAPSGISSAHIDLSHIRGYIQSSWPIAGTKNPSLLLVSLYLLTIPLQHLSVTSIESLCKHTKALFAKFLFKFAHRTASSSASSWVKTRCSDSQINWKAILQSKLYWFLLWLMLKLNHSTINLSLSMINQCRGGAELKQSNSRKSLGHPCRECVGAA